VAYVEGEPDDETALTPLEITLPRPRIGTFEIQVTATYSLDRLLPAASTVVDLPLAMPQDARLESCRLEVTATEGIRYAPRDDTWVAKDDGPPAGENGPRWLVSSTGGPKLPLVVSLEEQPLARATLIERAWLQTWLAGNVRQDRAVYRLRSGARHVRIMLPNGVGSLVEIIVDGVSSAPAELTQGGLTIELPESARSLPSTVELRYQYDNGPLGAVVDLLPPQWEGAVVQRRTYWEVILPRHRHLTLTPAGWTPEFQWRWRGLGWGRAASLDPQQLAAWVGAQQAAETSNPAHRYLLSAVGEVPPMRAWIAPRWALVFVPAAVVLALGLMLIYLPATRHPATLLVVAVLVLAGAAVAPEVAVLAGQSAVVGVGLVIVAALVHAMLARRRAARRVIHSGGSSILRHSSTRLYSRPGLVGASISTASVTAAIEPSSSEPQA
jgi:hypothetical protein